MKHVFFLFLIVSFKCVCAQNSKPLARYLSQFDLVYKKPRGYKELDTTLKMINGQSGHSIGISHYNLISKKGDLLICFYFAGPIDTTIKNTFRKKNGEMFDPNRNYIPPNGLPYKIFPPQYTARIYNADISGVWDLQVSQNIHTLSTSEKCRVLFIHKENEVDIELYYYYTDMSERKLKRYMRRTCNMIRFKH